MNACEACREQIDLRMDGMLDPALDARLSSHLAQCAPCRQYDAAQQALSGDLFTLSRVAGAVAAPKVRKSRNAPNWMHAGKIAAALAFAVLCTWTFVRRPSIKPDADPAPVVIIAPHNYPEPRPPVRFAISVQPVDEDRRFVIPMKTENPHVHMVWLYDDALPVTDASPASAPSS